MSMLKPIKRIGPQVRCTS